MVEQGWQKLGHWETRSRVKCNARGERGAERGPGGGARGAGARCNLRERRSLQFRCAFSHCPANISVEHTNTDRRVVTTQIVVRVPVKRTVLSKPWSIGAVLSDSVFVALQLKVYR